MVMLLTWLLAALLAAARGCSYNELSETTFSDAPHLTNLVLSDCNILRIPQGVFKSIPQIKKLDLQNNSLSDVLSSNFEGLTNLVSLDLSENHLSVLPDDILHFMPTLDKLIISKNPLLQLSGNALAGSNLATLFGNNNLVPLSLAPRALADMSRLRYIEIMNSSISRLPADLLHGSNAVTEIHLSHNHIQDLPADLFADKTSLKILFIDFNELRVLSPATFTPLKNLNWLSLNYNQISEIKAYTFSTNALQSLSIRNNRLRAIAPDALPATLIQLYLENNELTTLVANTPRLSHLYLNNNLFSSIPPSWPQSLPALTSVELNHNAFTQLTKSDMAILSHYPNGWFHLKNNKIVSVLTDLNTSLPIEIFLEGAPLRCDCFMYAFGTRLQEDRILYDGDAKCAAPTSLEDTRLLYVKSKDFVCQLESCPDFCTCVVRPHSNALDVECREQLTDVQVTELENFRREHYSDMTQNTTIKYSE